MDWALIPRGQPVVFVAEGHQTPGTANALALNSAKIAYGRRSVPPTAGLVDRHRPGRPTFWSEQERAILQEALSHSPDEWDYKAVNWTVSLLREHIERESGRAPSDGTVRRELHRLEYVWKRSRHVLPNSK